MGRPEKETGEKGRLTAAPFLNCGTRWCGIVRRENSGARLQTAGGIGDGGKNFRCLLSGLMLRGIGLTDAELKILGVMHAGQ